MTKVRVFDIPEHPGYGITEDFRIIRYAYKDTIGRNRKEVEISVNYNAEYAQLDIQKGGSRGTAKLHRLIALTFLPNPDKLPQVNHKDGNKFNNSLDNLEWVSAADNVIHSYQAGLASNKGEKHPRAKFKASEIPEIHFFRSQGWTLKAIAELYGVCLSTIGKICTGVNYREGSSG